jgi:hypothetical protein
MEETRVPAAPPRRDEKLLRDDRLSVGPYQIIFDGASQIGLEDLIAVENGRGSYN